MIDVEKVEVGFGQAAAESVAIANKMDTHVQRLRLDFFYSYFS